MKKFFKLLLGFSLVFSLLGCAKVEDNDDIIIIYTNDVHCGIDDDIGYAGLVAFKNEALSHSKYVTLVDAGDAIQGSSIGNISKGEAIVECLNNVGYDILTLGNHEFDYGYKRLDEIIKSVNTPYLNSNVVYNGNDENIALNDIEKYKIIEYGERKVGFISLLTPRTKIETTPSNLQENGEYVIDLLFNDTMDNFYNNVQNIVDKCKEEGADYVICLAHFGSNDMYAPFSSNDLAANTSGIDVIIDAHQHEEASYKQRYNKNNESVIITSSGTKLNNIGEIVISPSGYITVTIIGEYANKDEKVQNTIEEIKAKYISSLEKTLFTNEVPLSIYDDAGIRVIRNKTMPIADLITDAFRYALDSDIVLINGGGIRTDLKTGEISTNDIIDVMPFGNLVSSIEMTGQEIVDYLEYTSRYTEVNYAKGGNNICEYGSFMHCSGMKYTINTSIKSVVEVNEDDNFIAFKENRRVSDVMILNDNGEYEPIDLAKTYVVGGNNYSLLQGGSGTELFLKDHNVVVQEAGVDYNVLYSYITEVLNCDLSKYATSDNRIIIK